MRERTCAHTHTRTPFLFPHLHFSLWANRAAIFSPALFVQSRHLCSGYSLTSEMFLFDDSTFTVWNGVCVCRQMNRSSSCRRRCPDWSCSTDASISKYVPLQARFHLFSFPLFHFTFSNTRKHCRCLENFRVLSRTKQKIHLGTFVQIKQACCKHDESRNLRVALPKRIGCIE